MTRALFLYCGEVKFGASCPCPKCGAESTGDVNLDIAFSDNRMAKETLGELGRVVAAIHVASTDDKLCFWAFIRYISLHHFSILGVDLKPDVQVKCDAILAQARLPQVTMRPSPREEWEAKQNRKG